MAVPSATGPKTRDSGRLASVGCGRGGAADSGITICPSPPSVVIAITPSIAAALPGAKSGGAANSTPRDSVNPGARAVAGA